MVLHIFTYNFLNIQLIFNPQKVLESWDLDDWDDVAIITAHNEVGARLCFYTCLWFCSRGAEVCLSLCWDTTPLEQTPWEQATPLEHPLLGADPPTPYPQEQASPWEQTLRVNACWGIRTTSGRYAFYWNAILLIDVKGHLHGVLATALTLIAIIGKQV